MEIGRLKARIMKVTVYLELVLAIFITAAIVIGMVDLVKYIVMIFETSAIETYDVFQKFLGHVLLLVVGVELVAMLVMHTPGSVIEVLLYAIARNMLLGSKDAMEFIFGIAAIAGIFAIRKFLFVGSISDEQGTNIFSAAAGIREINSITEVNIPESIADTIGGVISHVSKEACRQVSAGAIFRVADAEVKVLSFKDGVIQRVAVTRSHE